MYRHNVTIECKDHGTAGSYKGFQYFCVTKTYLKYNKNTLRTVMLPGTAPHSFFSIPAPSIQFFFCEISCVLTKRRQFGEFSTFVSVEFGLIWCVLEHVEVPSFARFLSCRFLFACDLVSAFTFPFLGIHHCIIWLMQSVQSSVQVSLQGLHRI